MRTIKFRAWDDCVMVYSHNNVINHSNFQNKWFFESIREDAILMQFTGLHDKNGKEIYEGDVIGRKGFFHRVIHHDGINFQSYSINNPFQKHIIAEFSFDKYDEVIGNIYENPELLNS